METLILWVLAEIFLNTQNRFTLWSSVAMLHFKGATFSSKFTDSMQGVRLKSPLLELKPSKRARRETWADQDLSKRALRFSLKFIILHLPHIRPLATTLQSCKCSQLKQMMKCGQKQQPGRLWRFLLIKKVIGFVSDLYNKSLYSLQCFPQAFQFPLSLTGNGVSVTSGSDKYQHQSGNYIQSLIQKRHSRTLLETDRLGDVKLLHLCFIQCTVKPYLSWAYIPRAPVCKCLKCRFLWCKP